MGPLIEFRFPTRAGRLRLGALGVAAVPGTLLVDAALRWWEGWRPLEREESMALYALGAAALLPLLLATFFPRSGLARRTILAQAVATLLLAGGEAALRTSSPEAARPYALPPSVRVAARAEGASDPAPRTRVFTTTAAGLRGVPAQAPTDLRIVVLGGSAAQCAAQDDRDSWPWVLQDLLSAATGRNCSVLNAGRGGAGVREHAELARRLPEVEGADAVVVMIGFEDACRALGATQAPSAESPALWLDADPARAPSFERLSLFAHARLTLRAGAMRTLPGVDPDVDHRRRTRRVLRKRDDPPDLRPFLAEYGADMGRLAETIRARGSEAVFVAQPTAYDPFDPASVERLLWFGGEDGAERTYTSRALRSVMDAVAGTIVAEARALSVPVACLEGAVPRTAHYFLDDCRLTDEGCRLCAGVLVPLVVEATGQGFPP